MLQSHTNGVSGGLAKCCKAPSLTSIEATKDIGLLVKDSITAMLEGRQQLVELSQVIGRAHVRLQCIHSGQ